MKQTVRMIGFTLGLAACAMACQDDLDYRGNHNGDSVEVALKCFSQPPTTIRIGETEEAVENTTRADISLSDKEYRLDNVWVFQFEGNNDDSKLLSDPFYSTLTQGATSFDGVTKLLMSSSKEYQLVLVANTNDAEYKWNLLTNEATYKQFLEKVAAVTEESLDSRQNLPMVASYHGYVNEALVQGGLQLDFHQSVAKLELNLTNATTDGEIAIKSVQLRNVPQQMRWNEGRMTYNSPDLVYPASTVLRADYKKIEDRLPDDSQPAQTYVWYIPANRLGETSNTIETQKNSAAPKAATYIEILAQTKAHDDIRFRFYPGKNLINNFNIEANYNYKLSIHISGEGDPETDTRVEHLSKVVFEKSNCYILNPPEGDSGAINYYIPIERVNDFWNNPVFERLGADLSKAFTETTQWACEVVWHDNALLYDQQSTDPRLTLETTEGTGISNQYLVVRLPAITKAQHGNMVVGIYRKDDPYIAGSTTERKYVWSWHLWVTDYNPDVNVSITEDKYTYPVPGGTVQRFGGKSWGYKNNKQYGAASWTSTPSTTTPYAGRLIMDRNLGIRATNLRITQATPHYDRRNPHPLYQFGRKDPIASSYYNMYDKDNKILIEAKSYYGSNSALYTITKALQSTDRVDMADAIAQPKLFYRSYESWLRPKDAIYGNDADNMSTTYIWYDLRYKAYNGDYTVYDVCFHKSLFDPCPPGWELPYASAFEKEEMTAAETTSDFGGARPELACGKDDVWGVRYWPYRSDDGITYPTPAGEEIFFPFFYGLTYNFVLSSSDCWIWSSINTSYKYSPTGGGTSPYEMTTKVATGTINSASMVRCVKEHSFPN